MKALSLEYIQNAVAGDLLQGDPVQVIEGISIDSRTIKQGEIFVAIIGERFDGHSFINDAIDKGAKALLVDREVEVKDEIGVIKVEDTTRALQRLASVYRRDFKNLKVIGITGSAGKTTTKDMIATLLAKKYNVLKTQGNFNNYYGLPLTLLQLTGEEEVAVIEMGMSSLGEIKLLAEIAAPEIGVITNVGPAHLETLGSIENVARGKSELISALPENGIAVLNYDNQYVRDMRKNFYGKKVIYYGLDPSADLFATDINLNKNSGEISVEINYKDRKKALLLNKPGKHNVYNALAAIAVARELNVSWQQIKEGLKEVKLSSLRWDIRNIDNKITVINDTYNANPLSMQAAVKAAEEMSNKRLITVLGAMLELGEEEESAHLELGQFVANTGVDILITVGSEGELIARGALAEGMHKEQVYPLENNQEAGELLEKIIKPGDTILVKGSRGIKMEEIVERVIK